MQDAKPKNLLDEQLAYYRGRAQEYDESVLQFGRFASPGLAQADADWQHIVAALHALAPVERALELACGTGLWTQELLHISQSVLALDGAPEMLEANRAKLNSDKVSYQQADLFNWQPAETYDLVFAAFWLSHVPPALLPGHLEQAAKAVKPGGRVFIVDEPAGGAQLSGPIEGEHQQTRALQDGSEFRIVKVYHHPQELADQLRKFGFISEIWAGEYFFYLNGVFE